MLVPQFLTGLFFLMVLSVLDFMTFNKKKGFIPSVATTLFLIFAFIMGFQSPGLMIEFGLFGALIGLLFTDLDLWGGIADFKIFVACSMLFGTLQELLVFALILTILAVLVKGIIKLKITKGKEWDIPFIPIILIAFIIAGVFG